MVFNQLIWFCVVSKSLGVKDDTSALAISTLCPKRNSVCQSLPTVPLTPAFNTRLRTAVLASRPGPSSKWLMPSE